MGYSGDWGKLMHAKNLKSKISWHCPFFKAASIPGTMSTTRTVAHGSPCGQGMASEYSHIRFYPVNTVREYRPHIRHYAELVHLMNVPGRCLYYTMLRITLISIIIITEVFFCIFFIFFILVESAQGEPYWTSTFILQFGAQQRAPPPRCSAKNRTGDLCFLRQAGALTT
jgi:hypothetical protein